MCDWIPKYVQPPASLHSDIARMHSIVVDLLSKTVVFLFILVGFESRFTRNAVQISTWNHTHVISNINPAVSFRCCCTDFVLIYWVLISVDS